MKGVLAWAIGGSFLASSASAQVVPPVQPQASNTRADWENPIINDRGRLPARASGFAFENRPLALQGDMRKSSRYIDLDGEWRFSFTDNADLRPTDFWQDDFDSSHWGTIKVPGMWQAQGYGQPKYNNITYPFPANRPLIAHQINSVGLYRRDFTLSPGWFADKSVVLHIGAAGAAYYVWINGKSIGYSEDSKLPSEFDVTPFLRPGRNNISLQVFRWSDGSYLEDQDFWRVNGIERDVYLAAEPKVRTLDTVVTATLDKEYRNGRLSINMAVSPGATVTARAVLLDGEREIWASQSVVRAKSAQRAAKLESAIPAPRQWSAEAPNLYTLVTELVDGQGSVLQSTARRIGFRTVEVKQGQVMVNGQPIIIRGVNRHEHDPETFHVISEASMRQDIEMMKRNNINAVRASHYPNAERWYELTDEYGLYVMDEANLESHAYMDAGDKTPGRREDQRKLYQIGFDPAWEQVHVTRSTNMVRRDRNHPSIMFWSLGNEAGLGPNFEKAAAAVRSLDPTRPVSYLGHGTLGLEHQVNSYVDIYAPMYDTLWKMESYAQDASHKQPMIQCEYAHMQGNSGGNLQDYWDVIYKYPKLQGGFIWDWVDQGMNGTDANGRFFWKMGGDYGANPGGDIEFGDGMVHADRRPNPHFFEVRKVYQPMSFRSADPDRGIVTITNRNDFQDLREYDFEWRVLEDGAVTATGILPHPQVPARGHTDVSVPVPPSSGGTVKDRSLVVLARSRALPGIAAGTVMAWEQFHLGAAPPSPTLPTGGRVTVRNKGAQRIVAAGLSELSVDATSGLLDHFTLNGQLVLSGGRPNFYRAVTDNDLGADVPTSHAAWATMSQERTVRSVSVDRGADGTASITVDFDLGTGAAAFSVTYQMAGTGQVKVSSKFTPLRDSLPDPLRVGLYFSAPSTFARMAWFGRGPHETYSDRKSGAPVARWAGRVSDQHHDYMRPMETGNKTDVRWFEIAGDTGKAVKVTGEAPLSINVLAFPYEDLDRRAPGTWRSSDIKPHGNVSVLIDAAQTGVGGDTAWSAEARAHGKYRIPLAPLTYSFTISPADFAADSRGANALLDLLGPDAGQPNHR